MIFKISDDRDLIIKNNDFQMTDGLEQSAQNVRATLWAWKGEAEFDLSHGTDYPSIFEKNVTDQEIAAVIQEGITQEPTIVNILSMSVTRQGRKANIRYTANSNNGVLESEVSIG